MTGASGAIGQAAARHLAGLGFRLHSAGRPSRREEELAVSLRKAGALGCRRRLDLSRVRRARAVVEAFFRTARNPVGLVCLAGNLGWPGPFWEVPWSRW